MSFGGFGLSSDVNDLAVAVFVAVGVGFVTLYLSLVALVWRGWSTILTQQATLKEQTQELSQSLEALGESELRFRVLFESAPVGIAIVDDAGTTFDSNHAFQEMVGYTPDELAALHFSDFTHTEDLPENLRLFQEMVAGKRYRYVHDKRYIRKDSSTVWVHMVVSRLSADHESFRCMAMAEDITEIRRAEERFRESARLASVGELAAGVAHEINNPLNTILGFTQLILREDVPEQVRRDLEKVNENTNRAARIVRNLLSFARRGDHQPAMIDLAPVVQNSLDLVAADLRQRKITVDVDLPDNLEPVMADEQQIQRVLVNLFQNAQHAMADAGGGQLTIRGRASVGMSLLSVTDDGPGIAPENLSRVFDPFFTTKKLGDGTGLGLSICHGLIREHGGEIRVESAPGRGATFHIELPTSRDKLEDVVTVTHNRVTAVESHELDAGRQFRILVVDDEPDAREFISRALSEEGHAVDLAEDGEEAWRKLQAGSYDRILMDLRMPKVDGQELYSRIQATMVELASKVIFMTGDTLSDETEKFLSGTGCPAISKPFELDELRQYVTPGQEGG